MLTIQSRRVRSFRHVHIWIMLVGIGLAMILTACGQAAEAQGGAFANQAEAAPRSSSAATQSANEIELTGVVTAISNEAWTIDTRNIAILPQTEIKGVVGIGTRVTVHAVASADGLNVVLEFTAQVNGKDLKGIDMVQFDAEGKIVDFEVMVRPLSGLQALGEEMGKRLAPYMAMMKDAKV